MGVGGRLKAGEIRRRKAAYGELFSTVAAVLFKADPVGINFEVNTDEYESEVATILPRLRECTSETEARVVMHQEFTAWFGAGTAGPEESYTDVAREVWTIWLQFQRARRDA